MSAVAGRRVVLGVSGGIAAYKAIEVCRRLVDAGAHVVPVLTSGAQHFVGAVTFSALASEPAKTSLWDDTDPIPHTALGQSADVVVVVPATARVIGAYAAGISSDLLTATLLATRAPVVVCPAMHTEMWEHPAVQENRATLRRRGDHVVEPAVGRLAGGDPGAGRPAGAEGIVAPAAAEGKIKKDAGPPEIILEPTTDILAVLGERRRPEQVLVGFAAETADLAANAAAKLARKRLDLIVANDVSAPGVGFDHDTNAVMLLSADGTVQNVTLSDKRAIARAVLDTVVRIRLTR